MTIIEYIVLALTIFVVLPLVWRMTCILGRYLEARDAKKEGYEECLKKWGKVILERREEIISSELLSSTHWAYDEDIVSIECLLNKQSKNFLRFGADVNYKREKK